MNGIADLNQGWFRLWSHGPGLHWTTGPAAFSERYGYVRPILKLGAWRVFFLRGDER